MWHVLFKILVPLPLALAANLFKIGPSSTKIALTYNFSASASLLYTAFCAADLTTFEIAGEAALLVYSKIPSASLTVLPLTKSTTNLA